MCPEVRRIRERLAVTEHRSALEIVERWAVRPGDLQQALIEIQPHIVHFSGHGTTEYELMLEGAICTASTPRSDLATARPR